MKSKKHKILVLGTVFALLVANISACAESPLQNVVTSKNDGSFDVSVIQSAPSEVKESTDEIQNVWYSETFTSTDYSVEYSLSIDQNIPVAALPVVEVCPHYFTTDDAQNIANALFGDAEYYEAEPALGKLEDTLSKSEIQESIQRWLPYTNRETLIELFPNLDGRNERIEMYLQRIREDIELYNSLLEEAPKTSPHMAAKWEFQPEWNYLYSKEEIKKLGLTNEDCNEQICVTLTSNDIPYLLNISVHNEKDFKLNTIFAYPYTVYSPMGIDSSIFHAQLCRTDKPTAEQMESVKVKAQDILNSMGIGTWVVDECYLQSNNSDKIQEYVICVNAVPVFEGVSAMRRPQLSNLTSEDNFAASYYLTDAIFQFSANGDLVYFQLSSPVDIVEVINNNVATVKMDELIEKAKNHLMLSDYNEYGISGEVLKDAEENAGEDFVCRIDLSKLDYGMIRVKVPNSNESYYYVPGIILSGSIDYYGKDSGTLYESSGETIWSNRIVPLVALNAIDGSIIDLYND